jgi:hypothetical protein
MTRRLRTTTTRRAVPLKAPRFRGALSSLRANLTNSDGDSRRTVDHIRTVGKRTVGHRRMVDDRRKARDKAPHSSRAADTGRVPGNTLADNIGAPHRAEAAAAPAAQPLPLSSTRARVLRWPTTIVAWYFFLSCHGSVTPPRNERRQMLDPSSQYVKRCSRFKGVTKILWDDASTVAAQLASSSNALPDPPASRSPRRIRRLGINRVTITAPRIPRPSLRIIAS